MPRIQGVDIPPKKPIHISLRYIYGIGPSRAFEICYALGINPQRRANELTDDEVSRISALLDKEYVVEGNLRRAIQQNIARLKEIQSYRGYRHRRNLPVRGQRTRTNARTRKGVKKTVAVKRGVKDLKH
ncbi:MAG: 30S ribosomal protein S13 [Planctomycetaceae bacterium]|nr:MAG: 30S ribosomal protein S13 [Planctomycetaceae bacterium]